VRFGIAGAPRLSSFDHVCTVVFFALVGLTAQEDVIYWFGLAAVAVALFWEYRIVSPNDLSRINRAFFNYNAYVSIDYFLATIADSILNSRGSTLGWT